MKKTKQLIFTITLAWLVGRTAFAQFVFNPLSVVPSNAPTYWNPTNVLGTFTITPHLVQISAANFGNTNTLTIAVRVGIDNTFSNYPVTFFTFTNNATFSNNVTGGPVSSNGTYTVYIPQQTINVYGSALVATTNDANTNLQVGAFLIY
jgi:hypothetical protein